MQLGVKNQKTNNFHGVMTRVLRDVFAGTIADTIDKIPEELVPAGSEPQYYDSFEAERTVVTRQISSIIGVYLDPKNPPAAPLSEQLKETLARKPKDYVPGASIIPEGCKKCGPTRYFVTDACEGCVARPCMVNCPKKCISRVDGKAVIDSSKCIGCGTCSRVCPYQAIIRRKTPCMDDCPVDAISKDADNRSVIDPAKCIHCGRCTVRCPFGTIVMPSHVVQVAHAIQQGKNVIAMFAPAVFGQFPGTTAQMGQACVKAGFSDMVEVAVGADETSLRECAEWMEEVGSGKQRLLATSCCPAWVRASKIHFPGLAPFVSGSQSPMGYIGDTVRKAYPDAVIVFVGPCTAKRTESLLKENIDYVLTAEELSCIFDAQGVEVLKMPKEDIKKTRFGSAESAYYCATQGVTAAVVASVPKSSALLEEEHGKIEQKNELKPVFISPLDKDSAKKMRAWSAKPDSLPGNLLEVMCCDGGCIAGPGNIAAPTVGISRVKQVMKQRPNFNDIEDVLALK